MINLVTIISDIRCEIYYDQVADATYRRRRNKLGKVIWERQTDVHEWHSGVTQIPGIGEELVKNRDQLLTESTSLKIAEMTICCPAWKILAGLMPPELVKVTQGYFWAVCPWQIKPMRHSLDNICGIRFYVGHMAHDEKRERRFTPVCETYTGVLAYGKPVTVIRQVVRDQPLWEIVGKNRGIEFLCATKQMILNIRRKEIAGKLLPNPQS